MACNHAPITWQAHLIIDGTKPRMRSLVSSLPQAVGVELNKKGAIVVDQYSHTNVDSIWAIGVSVTGHSQTEVANLVRVLPIMQISDPAQQLGSPDAAAHATPHMLGPTLGR